MGSLCTSGPSTSTYAPNPAATQQYQQILGRANEVASTPYQAYTGQQVANLTPEQQAGISNVNNAYGTSSPYFNQASQYATQGAAPVNNLTSADINQYYSPYQNDVVNATMANINETNAQQQNQLKGSIASRGALGGDRQSVLQSELARQQGLAANQTLAGLQNQGFQTAAGLAQGQQANQQANAGRAGQAAFTFGNLGNSVQNAATQGGFAQIAAGGVGQQNQQQQLSSAFNDYLRQQAFPYQQTGWLAGVANPTAGALGGTQTNQAAQPSPLQTIGGLGLTAAGLAGGNPFAGAFGSLFGGNNASSSPGFYGGSPSTNSALNPATYGNINTPYSFSSGGAVKASFGDSPYANDMGFIPSAPIAIPMKRHMAHGGLVDTIHAIRHSIRSRYADGGGVPSPFQRVDDAFADLRRAADDGTIDPQGSNYNFGSTPYAGAPSGVPMPPQQSDAIPPQATPTAGPSPMANPAMTAPQEAPAAPQASPLANPSAEGSGPFNLSEDQRHGLLATGLGMLASKGPNAFAALGEGGLKGVAAMAQVRKEREDRALRQQHADVEARRLAQQAEQFAKTFGQHEATLAETKRQHDLQFGAGKVPPGYRVTSEGALEAIPGGPHDPEVIKTQTQAKQPGGRLDPDTISDMAGQYLAGDKSVFQNLGRGAQGAENIVSLRQEVARQAREAGLKPDQIATKMADFAGRTAAMRALGTRGVNVEYAANTANKAIDLAEEALGKVPRTQFVPFNQLRQLIDTKTSSPEQAAFYTATNTLVNEYARVAAGGSNQATEGMRQHAREMLNTAMGPEAYKATLNMMRREIQTAKKAYTDTRKEFLSDHTEEKPETPASSAASPKIGERKQFKQGWGVWDGKQYVPEGAP